MRQSTPNSGPRAALERARARWPLLTELVLFGCVGAFGMTVDLSVLTAAVEVLGLEFRLARVLGFAVAVSCNFALNDRITFRGPGKARLGVRYLRYVAVSSGGMAINYAVSVTLFAKFAWFEANYPVAAAAGVVAGTTINFLGAKLLAFRREDSPKRD